MCFVIPSGVEESLGLFCQDRDEDPEEEEELT